jgi:uncharacterized protein DUF5677
LLLAIFARSTLTYRAIMHLCRGGYGEQADMLNRSLFEDMAAAHWVSMHREEAVERIEQHHHHSRVIWDRVLERRGLEGRVDLGLEEETIDELDKLFGKHGNLPWLGLGMWDLVTGIEGLWEKKDREQLWLFYELAHRANNQKLHLSSFAINRIVNAREDDDGITFEYDVRPSIDADSPVRGALFGAWWIYAQLVGLLLDVSGEGQDELTRVVSRHADSFKAASDEFAESYSEPAD